MARRVLIKCWCHRIPQHSFAESSHADPTNKTNGRMSLGNLCVSLSGFIQSCASRSAALSHLFYVWLCSWRNAQSRVQGLWVGSKYKWAACFRARVCFWLCGPVTATIISHIFKASSPLTIRRRHVTCRRYLPFTLPFALCCCQRSIILPHLVTPTKETSQARSRGEMGKKTAATPIGCWQCHLWINSVSVWLFFPLLVEDRSVSCWRILTASATVLTLHRLSPLTSGTGLGVVKVESFNTVWSRVTIQDSRFWFVTYTVI